MDIMKYENLDIKFLIHKLEMQNIASTAYAFFFK